MRDSSPKWTPCEVIREINDLCQGDSKKDKRIRLLCGVAETMAKRLARELHKHSKEIWKNNGWWPENAGWRNKGKRRTRNTYKYDNGKEFFRKHK